MNQPIAKRIAIDTVSNEIEYILENLIDYSDIDFAALKIEFKDHPSIYNFENAMTSVKVRVSIPYKDGKFDRDQVNASVQNHLMLATGQAEYAKQGLLKFIEEERAKIVLSNPENHEYDPVEDILESESEIVLPPPSPTEPENEMSLEEELEEFFEEEE